MFGFLNINKPSGITSHKVISILRKIIGIKQIGHAGTLDPLASGVLPVAIGKACKLIDYMDTDKRYTAQLYFGQISDTYDVTGNIKKLNSKKVTQEEIEYILPSLCGKINQVPPVYSAVHYNGHRLYELARKGKIPNDIPSRTVVIYNIDILSFDYEKQILELDIECSKGTYIRTIINDIGILTHAGALMSKLQRTKSGGMYITDSINIEESFSCGDIEKSIINPLSVIKMNNIEINEIDYYKLKNGNNIENKTSKSGSVLLTKEGKILAVAHAEEKQVQPRKVLI